jgi:hypothetical protein
LSESQITALEKLDEVFFLTSTYRIFPIAQNRSENI